MTKPEITVEGVDRLVRALKKAEADDLLAQLKKANQEAAGMVHAAAATKVPIGETGKLAASLRGSATERAAIVRAGRASVPYAAVIHFGWARRGIRPQPFLYEALDSRRAQVLAAYEDAIEDVVKQVNANG